MGVTQALLLKRFEYKDGHLYNKGNFSSMARKGQTAGYLASNGYIKISINGKKHFEHRLVFLYHYGRFPSEIDHINHDSSDNRIENLREATRTENNANERIREDGSSRFKGVYLQKKIDGQKKWVSQIAVNKCNKYLGIFDIEEEAAVAYDEAAIEAFGKFAHTNKDAGLL